MAVLVGIDRYGNGINSLRAPISDVERLGEILATKHQYSVEPIVKDATKAELQVLLARLLLIGIATFMDAENTI